MELTPVTLEGAHVRLEPLDVEHADALARAGSDPSIWTWFTEPLDTPEAMRAWVDAALALQRACTALPFAIVERGTNTVVGSTRFGAISIADRRAEIGWTWIAPAWQRTAINTEAKLLMLTFAFERMGCTRVEFKTDQLNERSRAAIRRLGATQEGTLRSHIVTASGRVRDTIYYSILATEWAEIEARLTALLKEHAA